jgi:hypothetical protein
MTPPRPRPREWAREHLELRVDPEPVRPSCPSCGDELFAGDYRDPASGRCIHCVGRTTSRLGCASTVALVVTAALVIALIGWLAAPRGASGPVPPQALALPGVPSAAPSGGPAAAGDPREPSGGTPNPAVARTEVLGDLVGAGRQVSGWAAWCAPTPTRCHGWDTQYVGAVPSFRHGDDPYAVQVCLAERPATCTHVVVVSFCACGDRKGEPTVIDLSPPAFRELAPQTLGIVRVVVSGPIPVPSITLPPTEASDD